jgi:hypothetical protein
MHKSFICHSYKKHRGGGTLDKANFEHPCASRFDVWQRDALSASSFVHRLLTRDDRGLEQALGTTAK